MAKKFLFCLRGAGSDAFKGAGATSGAGDITADGLWFAVREVEIY